MGTRNKRIIDAMHQLRRLERGTGQPVTGLQFFLVVIVEGDLALAGFPCRNSAHHTARNRAAPPRQSPETETAMTENKHYVCQTYRHEMRGQGKSRQPVLVQAAAVECGTAEEAEARARKMYAGGSLAGADAFAIEVDPELGDYGDPAFLCRLGEVPQIDV